jgi:O-antigen/teichoic acid export membrane protein
LILGVFNERIARWYGSQVARNAAWVTLGQLGSYVVQALYFIGLARLLGSREYGILAGAIAFVTLVSPYAACGSGAVFLKYVSIDADTAPLYLGNVVLWLGGFGSILILVVSIVSRHVLDPASAALVLVIAISDCLLRQISVTAAQVYQAFERMGRMALLSAVNNLFRLIAVGVLLLTVHRGTAMQWVWASLVATAATAILSAGMVVSHIRRVRFSLVLFGQRAFEGLGFAFAASTNSIYNDVDKTLLSHYRMDEANGIYTTAYRLIDLATTPIWSLYQAALPRMFREGSANVAGCLRIARKLLLSSLGLGVLASAVCWLAAPLLPHLVGHSFSGSVSAVRWLALLPVFRAFALSAGAGLTASDRQGARTSIQVSAAVFNLVTNLYLIPRYSWLGAAWSSLATDAFMGVGNWVVYLYLTRMHAQDRTLSAMR